ncbi:MAG: DUF2865 domain-containing protein [Xanthobacteraceae bacterium]|nr:MAG: DUF2865 domain-containing protein [Xanthobacteraceae bacterium]
MAAAGMAREPAHAGLLDFLWGKPPSAPAPAPAATAAPSAFNPFGLFDTPPGPAPADGARFSGYCVRLCDGRYFPLQTRGASAVPMCQAFCPASPTKVFSGGGIDHAVAPDGARYADLDNAYVYRAKLIEGCTCNGRDSLGLAPVDLALDATLRPGDIVATATGLVAYSGNRVGDQQTAEFTPVNSYPGLTPDLRARLGGLKVSPAVAAYAEDTSIPAPEITGSIGPRRARRP